MQHKPEHERTYPDKDYDRSAFDRLYGDGTKFISSKESVVEQHMSIEERAMFLYNNGYVDKETVSLKSIIKHLEELDAKERTKKQHELNQNNKKVVE